MLLDYALREVTRKAKDLRVLDRVEGTIDGTGADTQILQVVYSTHKIGKSLVFFRLIGENQCGRITRNTEKNLPGLAMNMMNKCAKFHKDTVEPVLATT